MFAKPGGVVLVSPYGGIAPGYEVPIEKLRRDGHQKLIDRWRKVGMLVEEQHFKTYFPEIWNQMHAQDGEEVPKLNSPESRVLKLQQTGGIPDDRIDLEAEDDGVTEVVTHPGPE